MSELSQFNESHGKLFIHKHRHTDGTICRCNTWRLVVPFEDTIVCANWETAMTVAEIILDGAGIKTA